MNIEAKILERTLKDLRADLEEVQRFVGAALVEHKYTEFAQFSIRLCLEEAIVNAFRHGNRGDPNKVVKFRCKISDEVAEFEVRDQGVGFDPGCVPDPTAEENLEIPSGRGIMLMRAYMSEVAYLPPGNILRMEYKNGPDRPA